MRVLVKDIFSSSAARLTMAIGIALILIIFVISFSISDKVSVEEAKKSGGFTYAGSEMEGTAAPIGIENSASSVALSRGKSYVPKPADMKSFSFDARRMIFARKGDALTLEAVKVPPDVDLSENKIIYTTSDDNVATVDENGTVTATGWGKCVITGQVGEVEATCAVAVAKKWAAITFDDGPGKDTRRLLKAMEERNINSTFFVVGQNAADDMGQDKLRMMEANGDEIANHTYRHDSSFGNILSGLKKTDDVIAKVTGKKAALMRPPGGAINGNTKRCGKPIIMWSIDPRDWQYRNADYVFDYVTKHTKSGYIVLLHDIHKTSVDAGIRIFDALEKKGFTFVTVSQLLENKKPNTVYNSGPEKVRTMKILY